MSTWQIEHIPAGGGASTLATLGAWGFASLQMQFTNWGVDQAAATARGGSIAFDAAQFGYLDKLVVWRDGARHSHWWIVGPALNAETQESRTYTLAGPAWWLEQTPFAHPQHVVDITTDPDTGAATGCTWEMLHGTEVVWTSWPAQSSGTINGQINRALWCAKDNDAPIGIGVVDMPGLAAPISGSGTCMSVMQQAARLLPRSACWWDSSGVTPLFHASSRAGLSAQTLTIGTHDIEAFGLQPRADQRMDVVRVVYTYPDGDDVAAWFDTAGNDTLKDGPNTLRAVVECPTSEVASNAASHYGIAAQLYGALSETPWEGSVILHDTGGGLPTISLGAKLSLAGGRAEWATMNASIRDVSITISDSANDAMSVGFGAPPTLGAQDIFEALNILAQAGAGAVSSGGGTTEPTDPADDSDPIPGTLDDLNGITGAGTPSGTIAVQSRGGAWTKKGFGEFPGHVSTPPRRYLSRTPSGAAVLNCSTSLYCIDTISGSGSAVYNPATDTISPLSLTAHGSTADSTSGLPPQVYYSGCNPGLWQLCYDYVSATRAEYWHGRLADCAQGSDGYYCVSTGKYVLTQGNEDTEDSASARMLAVAEWTGGATTAIRTVPTTGITGIFRRLRYRTEHTVSETTVYPTLTGLAIWARYRLRIVLQKRAVDSAGAPTGDYATAETVYSAPFTTDLNGEGGVDWAEIEPSAGYETAIQSATPELY